jgi:nitrile hydratase
VSYRSHADLGGCAVPGRIEPEPEDERFHAGWEPRVLALTLAMGATGSWNLDMGRSARETLPDYAALSYYEIWFEALQKLLLERGLVLPEELRSGQPLGPGPALPRVLQAQAVSRVLAAGAPTQRPATVPARFAVGDTVRTHAQPAPHHTRLPAYARGKVGRIDSVHGMHVFPDANAQGLGEKPQWLYTVAFDGAALWGDEASAGLVVSVDAWESYLEPAA